MGMDHKRIAQSLGIRVTPMELARAKAWEKFCNRDKTQDEYEETWIAFKAGWLAARRAMLRQQKATSKGTKR